MVESNDGACVCRRTKDFLNILFPGKRTFYKKLMLASCIWIHRKELNFKVGTELAHKCKSYRLCVFWDMPFSQKVKNTILYILLKFDLCSAKGMLPNSDRPDSRFVGARQDTPFS